MRSTNKPRRLIERENAIEDFLMLVDILTLFPDMLRGVFAESILHRAQEKGLLTVRFHDIRTYTLDKHKKVDDRPFGGGPGMLLRCQPVIDAVRAVRALERTPGRLLFMCPGGRKFSQTVAQELAEETRLLLVCGRYEGFDQRIFDILRPECLSIGDYVLSGGELAAAVIVDAAVRLLPGALGDAESAVSESFSLRGADGGVLLDYPNYTQPAVYAGIAVPEVLRGGNHALINQWREQQSALRTRRDRPDL